MTSPNEIVKSNNERRVFDLFAAISEARITQIDSRRPPEPDILCNVEGRGSVAFEMVEIIDKVGARNFRSSVLISGLFFSACHEVSPKPKAVLTCSNALVSITFRDECSEERRKRTIPIILNLLGAISPECTGRLSLIGELRTIVQEIRIERSRIVGPLFHVNGCHFFGNTALEKLRSKFKKKYETTWPIELLAYHDVYPPLIDDWQPAFDEVHDFLRQNLNNSPFCRVWIFNSQQKNVLLVYPETKLQ